jgi:hypothetical protein
MSTPAAPPLPLYQPPDDLSRFDILYTFADAGGYYGRVYLTTISELPGADLLATLCGDLADDDDDVLSIEDYLLQASSDPRNAGWVNPLREDDEIVGVALHLRTAEGLTRTLSENVGDHVIGVNIVGFAPLSDEEIAEYETEEP